MAINAPSSPYQSARLKKCRNWNWLNLIWPKLYISSFILRKLLQNVTVCCWRLTANLTRRKEHPGQNNKFEEAKFCSHTQLSFEFNVGKNRWNTFEPFKSHENHSKWRPFGLGQVDAKRFWNRFHDFWNALKYQKKKGFSLQYNHRRRKVGVLQKPQT